MGLPPIPYNTGNSKAPIHLGPSIKHEKIVTISKDMVSFKATDSASFTEDVGICPTGISLVPGISDKDQASGKVNELGKRVPS